MQGFRRDINKFCKNVEEANIERIKLRFNVIDRAQMRAKADIMAVEDEEIFKLIDEAATNGPNTVTVSTNGLTRQALTEAFKEIEKHDLVATKIVMNAQAFADIRVWGRDEFDPVEVA